MSKYEFKALRKILEMQCESIGFTKEEQYHFDFVISSLNASYDEEEIECDDDLECECLKKTDGCFQTCPEDENMRYKCSRNLNHTGEHYACGASGTHKIISWR